jgi:Phage major tail protein 2.
MKDRTKLYGKMMGVTVESKFISCELDSTLNFDKDMVPVSSVQSGKWAEFIPGKRNWQMSINMALLKSKAPQDFKTLYQAWFEDTKITVAFRTRLNVDQFLIFEGEGYVKSGDASAPRSGLATGNMVIIGSGILNMSWEEFWLIINAQPANADKPNIVDTTEWS